MLNGGVNKGLHRLSSACGSRCSIKRFFFVLWSRNLTFVPASFSFIHYNYTPMTWLKYLIKLKVNHNQVIVMTVSTHLIMLFAFNPPLFMQQKWNETARSKSFEKMSLLFFIYTKKCERNCIRIEWPDYRILPSFSFLINICIILFN